MPIAPALPFGGLAGLRFLERTFERQFATFNKSADIEREIAHFLDKAGSVTSVDDLMADRRLLAVVLGAFGLDDDIDKGAFIRKVIEEGTLAGDSFANRLVAPAYAEMSSALGFGDLGGLLIFGSIQQRIVERYRERQFELAVGEIDIDMRLALNFKREAARIADGSGSDDRLWLQLLGSPPLRQVVEGAFGLPREFALIDLDRQLETLKERAGSILGGSGRAVLQAPGTIDRMVERFMLTRQIQTGAAVSGQGGSVALSLLQAGTAGPAAAQNLVASNFL